MFDLKCKRMNCKYNEKCNCTAGKVNVARSTACETYEKSEKQNTPGADEIEQSPTRKNTSVRCEAKCLFNDERTCKANGISVMTNEKRPECCTFMPK